MTDESKPARLNTKTSADNPAGSNDSDPSLQAEIRSEERQPLHERLRELLGSARAESCRVVATFRDIRGFSTFSAQGESFDSALYLRTVP
jgi:hypothetical protein